MKDERGFTLVEMLVVLLIISVLILVTIPNVAKHFATIDKKGCDAYVLMVQGQVEIYKLDTNKYPEIEDLENGGYIPEKSTACPDGTEIKITPEGKVIGPESPQVQNTKTNNKSDG